MSFICGICKKPAPAGTRCTLVKVKTKEINHPFRPSAHTRKGEDGKIERIADQGGKGVQTVKELKVCVNCAQTGTASE